MRPSLRFGLVAALAAGICVGNTSCQRLFRPSPLVVKSAAEGRSLALAVAVAPDPDRSFTRIGAVAQGLGLPFDAATVRSKLIEMLKLPPAATDALDTSAPVAVVMLPSAKHAQDPEMLAAFKTKSAGSAKAVVRSLGKPVARQNDAASFKLADGTVVWFWSKDGVSVAASSLDAIVAGAALGMESLARSEVDVAVTVRPDIIAKSRGTDVKTAMGKAEAQVEAAVPPTGLGDEWARAVFHAMLDLAAQKVVDTEEARLSIQLDSTRGAEILLALQPRPGSALAKAAGGSTPLTIEPGLLSGAEPTSVMASSPGPWLADIVAAVLPSMAKAPDVAPLATPLHEAIVCLSGAFSSVTIPDQQRGLGISSYQLATGVSGEAYLAQIETVYRSPQFAKALESLHLGLKPSITRRGHSLTGNIKADYSKLPPEQAEMLKSSMGENFEFALTTAGDRVLLTTGRDARTRLDSLRAVPAAAKPVFSADLQAALDEGKGADAFFYTDLVKTLAGGPSSPLAQMPGLSMLNMPLWLIYRGGPSASYALRIPISTMRSVGSIAPALFMMGGMQGEPE